jgi:hypothetical protein
VFEREVIIEKGGGSVLSDEFDECVLFNCSLTAVFKETLRSDACLAIL